MVQDIPNIFFIVFDTMRKDAISLYNGRSQTPNIDAFAKDCVVCQNAISPAPWTVPSHASFFTGKYPSTHGVHETDRVKLGDMRDSFLELGGRTLVEDLRSAGYTTVGYSANDVAVNPYVGFDRGFDLFSNATSVGAAERRLFLREASRELEGYEGNKRDLFIRLLKEGKWNLMSQLALQNWKSRRNERREGFPLLKGADSIITSVMRSTLEEPFFLFLNLMEMHEPYFKNSSDLIKGHRDTLGVRSLSAGEIQRLRRLYYLEAPVIDRYFGLLIDFIRRMGWYDSSLIVVVSDHGQGLKDSDFYGHAIYLKDELIQVPLLMKLPGNRKFQISGYQSTSAVYDVIRGHAVGEFDSNRLSREAVFAESYGSPKNWSDVLHRKTQDMADITQSRDIFDMRKAVFKNGYKLCVNGTRGLVEEFKQNGVKVDIASHRSAYDDLLEELDIFKGQEKFTLPGS